MSDCRREITQAFQKWQIAADEPASTEGLGWPMNRTSPRWYRLERQPA